jgi:hypothetical protein
MAIGDLDSQAIHAMGPGPGPAKLADWADIRVQPHWELRRDAVAPAHLEVRCPPVHSFNAA